MARATILGTARFSALPAIVSTASSATSGLYGLRRASRFGPFGLPDILPGGWPGIWPGILPGIGPGFVSAIELTLQERDEKHECNRTEERREENYARGKPRVQVEL